jgi:hypothetical protein
VQLGSVLAREGHVGQHIVFAGIHQIGELGPTGAELIGHALPCFPSMFAVGLLECLPDRGGDNGENGSAKVCHGSGVIISLRAT